MEIVTIKRENNFEDKAVKLIRKATIARKILKLGGDQVRIVDIKQDNTDPDRKRSIFAFENTDKFQEIFSKVIEENRNERLSHDADEKQKEIDDLKRQMAELRELMAASKEA